LFFFIRNLTPLDSWLATARLRLTILPMSKLTSLALKPNSPRRWSRWAISDVRSSALVGMQPQLRQIPPSCSRSTTAVLRPSWAARIAAT